MNVYRARSQGHRIGRAVALLALLAGCIDPGKAGSENQSEAKRLRVVTYNVFVGFRNDDKRHEAAVAWIAAQRPGVVALQELNGYTREELEKDARAWGHLHVELNQVSSGFHLGFTSREPIEESHLITREEIWHGIIHARTYGIDFFVVHLAPKPEAIRLPETEIVLREIRRIRSGGPAILLGDFNSWSRLDDVYYRRESRYEPEYNVMDRYLKADWVDLVHKHQGLLTEKQASVPSLLKENRWGFRRIDYILASAELSKTSISARVVKEPATARLSDHYPVMADFDWP